VDTHVVLHQLQLVGLVTTSKRWWLTAYADSWSTSLVISMSCPRI